MPTVNVCVRRRDIPPRRQSSKGGDMKRISVILAGSTITLGLMGATGLHNRPAEARQLPLRAEQSRLRAHFDPVDNELRPASVSNLPAQQPPMRPKLAPWL